jgi:hypothetical protein
MYPVAMPSTLPHVSKTMKRSDVPECAAKLDISPTRSVPSDMSSDHVRVVSHLATAHQIIFPYELSIHITGNSALTTNIQSADPQ